MLGIALALAAVGPRLLGGIAVLWKRDRLHVAMGFAGGSLLGVALFGAVPEALELLSGGVLGVLTVAAAVALGAGAYAVLERTAFGHVHAEDPACKPSVGHIGAGGISVHAFIDGAAIGSAFQVSAELGLLVSAGVVLHGFSDGLNTVTVVLRHGLERRHAVGWLAVDAAAPVLGAALGLLVSLPEALLGGLLGFFAGTFLYLGAGSLVPEAHRKRRDRVLVWLAGWAGMALAFAASQLG